MAGISEFLNGLGYLFKKIPIADRLERMKTQIDKLEAEKNELLVNKADIKKAKRMHIIESELVRIRRMLTNATGSS